MDLLRPGYERVKDITRMPKRIRMLEKEAVLVSLENLMTFPFVEDAVESGRSDAAWPLARHRRG